MTEDSEIADPVGTQDLPENPSPKYRLNQTVYWISAQGPRKGIVIEIDMHAQEGNTYVNYYVRDCGRHAEDDLFPSAEALNAHFTRCLSEL